MKKNKIIKHLKSDIKTFKKEAHEDRELIKDIKHKKHKEHKDMHKDVKKNKMEKVMSEFKEGDLHSSSKKGPIVKKRSQAIAIGLSEGRRAAKQKKKK